MSRVDDCATVVAQRTERGRGAARPGRRRHGPGRLVRRGATAGRLLLVVHHLVVDGVSWRILLPDLAASASARGRQPPPVGTSFRRWAGSSTRRREHAGRVAETGALDRRSCARRTRCSRTAPLDPARDAVATARTVTLSLPTEVTEALLTAVPAAFHAEINDVLLTGLALAVARGAPTAGHRRAPGC